MGPFYCSADQQIYINLSFYDELAKRYGAQGDFANAYVLAHEMGHHVQNLSGISGKVRRKQQQVSEKQANALSVKLGSVDVSFTIALSWETARHKACDEGNNRLLSRSITQ
jgi:predicted metalloprotease